MRPVIKITSQSNSVSAGVFNMKLNRFLPLVNVRGLMVVFHVALLFMVANKHYFQGDAYGFHTGPMHFIRSLKCYAKIKAISTERRRISYVCIFPACMKRYDLLWKFEMIIIIFFDDNINA